jgi:hypothetical protein
MHVLGADQLALARAARVRNALRAVGRVLDPAGQASQTAKPAQTSPDEPAEANQQEVLRQLNRAGKGAPGQRKAAPSSDRTHADPLMGL